MAFDVCINRHGKIRANDFQTNNTTKDVGCASDQGFRPHSVKDHSKRVGYRIQYKGCFHKKGGLKIKRVGYKHHYQPGVALALKFTGSRKIFADPFKSTKNSF